MKIAIVTEFCSMQFRGGGEVRYQEIAKRLVKYGHRVDIICNKTVNLKEKVVIDGVNIIPVGPLIKSPPQRKKIDFLKYIFSVLRFMIGRNYDVIDANTYIPLFPSYIISRIKKTPVIATINIIIENWENDIYNPKIASRIEKYLFRLKFNRLLTVSNYAKNELVNHFKVKENRIVVVSNGIDLKSIESIKSNKKDGAIVFVGRLTWFKHIEDLIKATARVKEHFPKVKLKIIGDGQEKNKAITITKELKLEKNIIFFGKRSQEELIAEIKKSSVLVLPSTRDTFGIVLIEANACGVPVVAYDAGGAMDVVQNQRNGFLVKPRDIKELSEKIELLLKNKNKNRTMGKYGKRIVQEQYNWDNIAQKIEKVYEDVIKKD